MCNTFNSDDNYWWHLGWGACLESNGSVHTYSTVIKVKGKGGLFILIIPWRMSVISVISFTHLSDSPNTQLRAYLRVFWMICGVVAQLFLPSKEEVLAPNPSQASIRLYLYLVSYRWWPNQSWIPLGPQSPTTYTVQSAVAICKPAWSNQQTFGSSKSLFKDPKTSKFLWSWDPQASVLLCELQAPIAVHLSRSYSCHTENHKWQRVYNLLLPSWSPQTAGLFKSLTSRQDNNLLPSWGLEISALLSASPQVSDPSSLH